MKQGLFRKYAAILMLLVGIALVASGALQASFNYRDTRAAVERTLAIEARSATLRIEQYLKAIEDQVREVSRLPWSERVLDLHDRHEEYARLLKRVPAITQLSALDAKGIERLRVSRIEIDIVGGSQDLSASESFAATRRAPVHYGMTRFKEGSEPYLFLGLRDGGTDGWTTVAEINLRFVSDVIQQIRFGDRGRAFIVDRDNHLVAHPNASHVLRRSDLTKLPLVAMLRAAEARGEGTTHPLAGESIGHVHVLSAAMPIAFADWRVFVEQPEVEALRPVYDVIERNLLMVALGLVLALGAAFILARRLARPILTVQKGAAQLAAGALGTRIHVSTGDEIEALAGEFNHMAAQLQELYEGLERKVREKTAELEAANRHKSEFLANMSHELRTPLNAVIGMSEALDERYFGPLTDKQAEYVRDIRGSGQHLLSLINDILDLSKVEAGRMELDVKRVDLRAAVANCLTLIRERAHQHRLQLRCDPAAMPATWDLDERKFKQVVVNLLSNAVKFTPQGGEVGVAAREIGEFLEVDVWDTGVGIAEGDQGAIFEEFRQVAPPGESKQEGTGLGLALARRLVALHGGTLAVRSEPGRGSTFTARFPRRPGGS
jgi:signal transduction histidine kinase